MKKYIICAANFVFLLLSSVPSVAHSIKEPTKAASSLTNRLALDYWVYEGKRYNDLILHVETVNCLSAVIRIQKKPLNIDAYQEPFHTYFELGNPALAIEAFKKVNQLETQEKTLYIDYFGTIIRGGRLGTIIRGGRLGTIIRGGRLGTIIRGESTLV